MNNTVFIVRVWGGQYREEPILKVTMILVKFWGKQ